MFWFVFSVEDWDKRWVLLVCSAFGRCRDLKLESRGGKWMPWEVRDLRLALLLDLATSELRFVVRSAASWACARAKAAVAAARACSLIVSRSGDSVMEVGRF